MIACETDVIAAVESIHPLAFVTVKENVPEVETLIDCVFAPVFHE